MNIRTMKSEDIEKVIEIERIAWANEAATVQQIFSRISTFPEGSIVAESNDGKIVGYAAAQLVNQISTKSWAKQTDEGNITRTHKPNGMLAYGVGMSASPEGAKCGASVGACVISHYHDIFIKSGRCSNLCLGSRLPGFKQWHKKTSRDIKAYLNQSVGGYSRDPELRLYQKNGFQLLWEIEGYYPDSKSLDYGAMITRR